MPYVPLPKKTAAATYPDPKTVRDVLDRLEAIQDTLKGEEPTPPGNLGSTLSGLNKVHDGLACFNHLYKVITAQINRKIEQDRARSRRKPFFHDDDFLVNFDVAFANRYLEAIRTYSDRSKWRATSKCWRILFENRKDHRISRMQFAVYGVICHVWMDLPIAVVQVCKETGKTLNHYTHEDYQEVDKIFYEKIPKLRRHFENHPERDIDHSIVRHFANYISDNIVRGARNLSWNHAKELWDVWDPQRGKKCKDVEDHLDNVAVNMGKGVLGRLP